MNISKIIVAVCLSILSGCYSTAGFKEDSHSGTVAKFESVVRSTTGAINRTAPGFNDINTCPKHMERTGHVAGGGGSSYIGTSEQGSEFDVDYSFGGGHGCNGSVYSAPDRREGN
ncbi:hypothetical protein KC851_04070 [Candidatus Kaiserbacteria bacterium]|nr:hypothetical protein [Candidatus Kaiserbacteria bacterium]